MNVEMYLVEALIAVFVCAFLIAVIHNGKQYNERIAWLQDQIEKRDITIRELNDRLMAKDLDNYKLWTQPPNETPEEPLEPDFDDSAVGTVSGTENIVDV